MVQSKLILGQGTAWLHGAFDMPNILMVQNHPSFPFSLPWFISLCHILSKKGSFGMKPMPLLRTGSQASEAFTDVPLHSRKFCVGTF